MTYKPYLSYPEPAANCAICLINQTNYLLDKQLKALEQELKNYGDFSDRFKQVRKNKLLQKDEGFQDLLTQHGLVQLENGQVVRKTDQN